MSKRKRAETTSSQQLLSEHEKTVLDIIKEKEDMGIESRYIKREVKNLPDNIVNKSLKSLVSKKLIKEVPNIQKRGKIYMAAEFEPSSEVTGGAWYSEGSLDTEFINLLKYRFVYHISKRKVATVDDVAEDIANSGLFKQRFSSKDVGEILNTLVLDNEVVKVKSTGVGEFALIKEGTVCYRCLKQQDGAAKPTRVAAMASIPCGVCPRINQCSPDGIISPKTCEYYTQWLLEF